MGNEQSVPVGERSPNRLSKPKKNLLSMISKPSTSTNRHNPVATNATSISKIPSNFTPIDGFAGGTECQWKEEQPTQESRSTISNTPEVTVLSPYQEGELPIGLTASVRFRPRQHMISGKSSSVRNVWATSGPSGAPGTINSIADPPGVRISRSINPLENNSVNPSHSEQRLESNDLEGNNPDGLNNANSTAPSVPRNQSTAPGLLWNSILHAPTYTQDEWHEIMLMTKETPILKGRLASHPKTKMLLEDFQLMAQFTKFLHDFYDADKGLKLSNEEIKYMHLSCRPLFEALAFLDSLEEEPSVEGTAMPQSQSFEEFLARQSFANVKEMREFFQAAGIPAPTAEYSSEGELLGFEFTADMDIDQTHLDLGVPVPEKSDVRATIRVQPTRRRLLLQWREQLDQLAESCGMKDLSSLAVSALFFSLSITILLDLGGIWVQSACWAVAALFLLKDACANHIYALTKPLNFRRAYLTISVPIMLIMSGAISMRTFTTNDPDRIDTLVSYYRFCVRLFVWCLGAFHVILEFAALYKFERSMIEYGNDSGGSSSNVAARRRNKRRSSKQKPYNHSERAPVQEAKGTESSNAQAATTTTRRPLASTKQHPSLLARSMQGAEVTLKCHEADEERERISSEGDEVLAGDIVKPAPQATSPDDEQPRSVNVINYDNANSMVLSESKKNADPTQMDAVKSDGGIPQSEGPGEKSLAPEFSPKSTQKSLKSLGKMLRKTNLRSRFDRTSKMLSKNSSTQTGPPTKIADNSARFETKAAIHDKSTYGARVSVQNSSTLPSLQRKKIYSTIWTIGEDCLAFIVMNYTFYLIGAAITDGSLRLWEFLVIVLMILAVAAYYYWKALTVDRAYSATAIVLIITIPGNLFTFILSMPAFNYAPPIPVLASVKTRSFWTYSAFALLPIALFLITIRQIRSIANQSASVKYGTIDSFLEHAKVPTLTEEDFKPMLDAAKPLPGSEWELWKIAESELEEKPTSLHMDKVWQFLTISEFTDKEISFSVRLENLKRYWWRPLSRKKERPSLSRTPKAQVLLMLRDKFQAGVPLGFAMNLDLEKARLVHHSAEDLAYRSLAKSVMVPKEAEPEIMYRFLTGRLVKTYKPNSSNGLNFAISAFKTRILKQRKLDQNVKRLEWTCKCGHRSHDDFQELSKDAVLELANEMFKAGYITHAQISSQASSPISSLAVTIQNLFTGARRRLSGLRTSTLPTFNSKTSSVKSIAMQCLPSQRCRWLHMCLKKPPYATKLEPLHVCKDEQEKEFKDATFFRALRRAYFGSKSWKDRLLFKLTRIEFVEFELCPEDLVDHILPDKLPPTLDEYEFLPPPPVKKCPPIGTAHMMHLFTSCSAQPLSTSLYLRHIPKRKEQALSFRPDVLDAITGWGLHFVEGLNSALAVSVMFAVSLLLGIVFAICWTIWRQDIQGAFGVASYVTSVVTLAVMTWQMWAV